MRKRRQQSGSSLQAPVVLLVAACIAIIYTIRVIKNFRRKGVEQFFRTGSKAKIQPNHAEWLRKQLFALDNAKSPNDMIAPGWRLHPFHGELQGHWAVDVRGNWRLTFAFDGEDAVLVDYRDYH
jgi:proteic killer suppression protein